MKGQPAYADKAQASHKEYAHCRALDDPVPHPPPKQPENTPSAEQPIQKSSARPARAVHGEDRRKRYGVSDPAVWDAINRNLEQQHRLSSLTMAGLPAQDTLKPSDIPSRTSSQRRILNHYAKELEKYAHAAGATGKAPVITPTESISRASLHTVKPLLPYRKEFQAAGLAVTSEEQRSPVQFVSSLSPRRSKKSKPAPRPQLEKELDGQDDTSTSSDSSSSGSFVHFSPPGGVSSTLIEPTRASRPTLDRKRRCLPWLRKKAALSQTEKAVRGTTIEVIKRGTIQSTLSRPETPPNLAVAPTNNPPTPPSEVKAVGLGHAMPKRSSTPQTSASQERRDRQRQASHPKTRASSRNRIEGQSSKTKEPRRPSFRDDRDMAKPMLPLPQTIDEEPEISQRPIDQCFIRRGSLVQEQQPKRRARDKASGQNGAPKPTGSPLPELPYTWKYAVSNPSSLERALNAVARDIENMDAETLREAIRQERSLYRPQVVTESTNGQTQLKQPREPPTLRTSHDHHALLAADQTSACKKALKKLPSQMRSKPAPATLTVTPLPDTPMKKEPVSRRQPLPVSENGPLKDTEARPTPPRRLEMTLSDLDVFFDYEDGGINNRDVLKGLHIAVQAAADDLFDAKIRQKTGLRIRRFLADLKAINVLDDELAAAFPADQPARNRRARERLRTGQQRK